MCSEKWQFIIQLTYSGIFLILSVVLTKIYNIIGFALAAAVANIIYMVFTIIVGIQKSCDQNS